jgi:hypothetical protein
MTSLQALTLATVVSLVLSTVLSLVIYRPLRAVLFKVCAGEEAVQFWLRFSVTMLFLSPLFVSIVFGLPSAPQALAQNVGALFQGIVATALVGTFLSMLGMGLWVSTLIRRAPRQPGVTATGDPQSWAARAER